MPILMELFAVIMEARQTGNILEEVTKFMVKQGGNKLHKALSNLTPSKEKVLKEKFGKDILNAAKDSIKEDANKKKNQAIPYTEVGSSWIEGISWNPHMKVLTLKVKGGKTYKLPFFPERVAKAMLINQSPGKTLWSGYWRVVGKGSVANKAKNLTKVKVARGISKAISKATPRIPTLTGSKKVLRKPRVKTSTIPKTGAKGVSVRIKRPKINKYKKKRRS